MFLSVSGCFWVFLSVSECFWVFLSVSLCFSVFLCVSECLVCFPQITVSVIKRVCCFRSEGALLTPAV